MAVNVKSLLERLPSVDLPGDAGRRMWHSTSSSLKYYSKGLYKQLMENDIVLWAGAIAFKVLIAFLPVTILIAGVFALVLRQDDPFSTVIGFIEQFLPEYETQRTVELMYALAKAGSTLTIIGVAGLLITAITLFATLRQVVSNVFHGYDPRSILGGYLFDLRLALQVVLLFTLSVGLTFFAAGVSTAGVDLLRITGLDVDWLIRGWRELIGWISFVLPFLITVAMFFQLFFFIPRPHPPVSSALLGAFITAILWELAKVGFSLYATYFASFDRYAEPGEVTLAPLGDFFGLIIALVFWVYYSGFVLIVGAIIAMLHQRRRMEKKQKKQVRGDGAAA